MHIPFNPRAPSFDSAAINETIRRAFACAGLDTSADPMHNVSQTIRRAMATGGLPGAAAFPVFSQQVIDVIAREVGGAGVDSPESDNQPLRDDAPMAGSFETCEFSNPAGARSYKLYIPAGVSDAPRPMMVMLHGCTQSADDFAIGTRMNRLADEYGFLVVYPEQPAQANVSKCWSWFKREDQIREAGEPSLIAGIIRDVATRHGADPRRIFVAGLSAGAAMAVVVGETYPDLIAGVGAHSGLPYASAHDIPSAMAAMKGGRSGLPGLKRVPQGGAKSAKKALQSVPTIVFHGDRDHTVQQTNGLEIVNQAKDAYLAQSGGVPLASRTESSKASCGRSYSRTVHTDGTGRVQIESWTIHGAAHAWSGGDGRGSFTDPSGPDASAEMVRFFLALPPSGLA